MAAATGRFQVDALGDKDLQRRLLAVPAAVEKRLLRSALRKGAHVIAAEARARVPVALGALKRSITVRVGKGGRGQMQYRVFTQDMAGLAALGARRTKRVGLRGAKREGFYPAAIEFGYVAGGKRTGRVVRTEGGRKRSEVAGGRHIPPRSFMRSALTARSEDAIEAVRSDLSDGLDEIARGDASGGAAP